MTEAIATQAYLDRLNAKLAARTQAGTGKATAGYMQNVLALRKEIARVEAVLAGQTAPVVTTTDPDAPLVA